MVVVIAGAWDVSSCSWAGATAASGTTDQHRQYSQNDRKNKIIILRRVMEAMLRPFLPDRLRSSLAGRVGPLHHLPTLLRFAWSTSPALTLVSLSLRIVRTGVPAGMLYVVKLVVYALVAGRADPTSGVPETDWLADPSLRHRPLGRVQATEKGGGVMALTRSFKDTVKARAERDPAFRDALLTEVVDQFLADDRKTGKAVMRDHIDATIGFERLAEETGSSSKSLTRMLSPSGNPTASNLFSVLSTVQRAAGVHLAAKAGR